MRRLPHFHPGRMQTLDEMWPSRRPPFAVQAKRKSGERRLRTNCPRLRFSRADIDGDQAAGFGGIEGRDKLCRMRNDNVSLIRA